MGTPRLWDISPQVNAESPVFPGDRGLESEWTFRISPDCPVNVAHLAMSPHTGAHADAPLHFDPEGAPAGDLDLEPFLGPCRVVHALGATGAVGWADVAAALGRDVPPRVIVRTYDRAPVDRWVPDFTALSAELVERLAALGVRLVGTDAASLDPADSKTLAAHRAAGRHDMRILENLLLDNVEENDYELIALPIKLAGADAAPVRAVLRELP